jgi:hypothetical protein
LVALVWQELVEWNERVFGIELREIFVFVADVHHTAILADGVGHSIPNGGAPVDQVLLVFGLFDHF